MKLAIKNMGLKLLVFHLKTIYFIFKLFPTEDKVSFLSRQSDEIPLDYQLIADAIIEKEPNIKTSFSTRRLNKGISSLFSFYFETIKQLYLFATSKVCIIDSYNIVASTQKHKKETKIIQIWHSLGKFKQTGFQRLDRKSGIKEAEAEILKMHSNYDYLIAGSEFWDRCYTEAFNISKDKVKNFGLPRASYFQKNQENLKEDFYKKHEFLRDKPLILYAPTFRKDEASRYEAIIENIDLDKYNLAIKLHPNDLDYKKEKTKKDGVFFLENVSTMEVLAACELIITDYSSLILESMLFSKPFLLYTYDLDEYLENNGLNFDFKEMFPMFMYYDVNETKEKINENYNWDEYNKLKNKMLLEDFSEGFDLFIDLIFDLINGEEL